MIVRSRSHAAGTLLSSPHNHLRRVVTCCVLFMATVVVQALPPGFIDEGVGRFKRVTDIAHIPKRATDTTTILLLSLKEGQLEMIPDADNKPEESRLVADFSAIICFNGERGLQSVIAHPDFYLNRYIYVYYTFKGDTECEESAITGPVNRCVRYNLKSDFSIDWDTERILFQTSRLAKRNHNGGDMVFGNDGYLYIATGDGGNAALSQDTNNLMGSLIRLDRSGGIPPDNPFADSGASCRETGQADSPCREIFSFGFRNPFKMALDPNEASTTRILVNDVGGQTWEEANLAGTGLAGLNYGWPEREGPCRANGAGGNNIEDCTPDERFQDPEHFYLHKTIEGTDDGGAIVGGAFLPNGHWPPVYDDAYLFADFVFEEIYLLTPTNGCRNCSIPTSNYGNETFHSFETVSAVHFAPYKDTIAMYYGRQQLAAFTVRRIVFVGGANTAPVASISMNVTSARQGETVSFSGAASEDADGDNLSFTWNFGDGTNATTGETVSHSYTSTGVFTVSLKVADGKGGVNSASREITIGVPPTVEMLSPAPGDQFAVGDILQLRGRAFNARGDSLDMLEWEVRQHHSTHSHPFLSPTMGANVTLHAAPAPEDLLAATNSHLEILLTATDRNGLRTTVSRIVMPKTVWLEFDTDPTGIDLYLDNFRIETPQRILSWENHALQVFAPDTSMATFIQWSNGSNQTHVIMVPPAATDDEVPIFVATYSVSWSVAWLDVWSTLAKRLTRPWRRLKRRFWRRNIT